MQRESDPQTYEQALRVLAQQSSEIERLKAQCDALSGNCVKHGSDIHRLELELDASRMREEKLRGMFLTAVEFGAIPPFDLTALRKQFDALAQDDATRCDGVQREAASLRAELASLKDCAAEYDTKFEMFERDLAAARDREMMFCDALKKICVSVCYSETRTFGERMGDINEIAKTALAASREGVAP